VPWNFHICVRLSVWIQHESSADKFHVLNSSVQMPENIISGPVILSHWEYIFSLFHFVSIGMEILLRSLGDGFFFFVFTNLLVNADWTVNFSCIVQQFSCITGKLTAC